MPLNSNKKLQVAQEQQAPNRYGILQAKSKEQSNNGCMLLVNLWASSLCCGYYCYFLLAVFQVGWRIRLRTTVLLHWPCSGCGDSTPTCSEVGAWPLRKELLDWFDFPGSFALFMLHFNSKHSLHTLKFPYMIVITVIIMTHITWKSPERQQQKNTEGINL